MYYKVKIYLKDKVFPKRFYMDESYLNHLIKSINSESRFIKVADELLLVSSIKCVKHKSIYKKKLNKV